MALTTTLSSFAYSLCLSSKYFDGSCSIISVVRGGDSASSDYSRCTPYCSSCTKCKAMKRAAYGCLLWIESPRHSSYICMLVGRPVHLKLSLLLLSQISLHFRFLFYWLASLCLTMNSFYDVPLYISLNCNILTSRMGSVPEALFTSSSNYLYMCYYFSSSWRFLCISIALLKPGSTYLVLNSSVTNSKL